MKHKKLALFSLFFFVSVSLASFPPDFLFGCATAAYQIEGAWNISRGPSVWDDFCKIPGKVANNDSGDVADDHYHRYVEDVALLKQLGFKNYRFSISWSRLFPTGVAPANIDGFIFYNNLINELKKNEIEPFVTLFHWDTPSALPGAWLNSSIVDAFAFYANATFTAFGDRVKNWITFNEPLTVCNNGYGVGIHAPGRCSDRSTCEEGDSSTEPYIVAHNMLLSHSAAVQLFRTYHPNSGRIGITLNCDWAEPLSSSTEDHEASVRHLEFQLAWFADPVFKGDYPQSMKSLVGSRLPVFTDTQKQQINGSWDYFLLNHYTSAYSSNYPEAPSGLGWDTDQQVNVSQYRDGVLIGAPSDSPWLIVVPYGINKLLHWVADRYNNPPLYITENGVDVVNESLIPYPDVLHDPFRISFYEQYLSNVSAAIDDGVQVKGYFAWSFMDNFEWADGYSKRFGLVYIDYVNNLTRHAKDSAYYFSKLMNNTANPNITTTTTLTSSTAASTTTTSGSNSLSPWVLGASVFMTLVVFLIF